MNVYFIGNEKAKILKIGVSQDPLGRMWELQRHCPYELKLFATLCYGDLDTALDFESQFHEHLKSYRIRGEWFHLEDGTRYVAHVAKDGDPEATLAAAKEACQYHDEPVPYFCSFCGSPSSAVRHLVAGYKGCICEECVTLSMKIFAERGRTQRGGSARGRASQ